MAGAHAEALRRLGVRVTGILGSSPEKSRASAKALGIERAYGTYDELLGDSEASSVHICTPNRLHFSQSQLALTTGKHVMCEKPLAMTSAESAKLVSQAKERSSQAAGVNYNVRFYPLCIEAHERVRGGEIGEIYHICGSYCQDWLLYDTDYNWRVLTEEGGELRAVADIGTHWLDLVHFMTGLEVEAACADLATVHPVRKRPLGEVETFKGKESLVEMTEPIAISTEDFGNVLVRFRGGARGTLWVSQVTAGAKNRLTFEIAGSQAALSWNSERCEELWVGRRDAANEIVLRDPSLLSSAAREASGYPGGHTEGYPDTFKQCFRAFYTHIAAGAFSVRCPYPTFEDGHRELLLCEAILQSARTGSWVSLPGDSP